MKTSGKLNSTNCQEVDTVDEILERFLNDDPEAIRIALDKMGERLTLFLRRKFGTILNELEIECAINSALFKAWTYRRAIDKDKNSRAWLFMICNNEALSLCKMFPKLGIGANQTLVTKATEVCPRLNVPTPERKLIVELYKIIDCLPKLQRDIVLADLAVGGEEHAGELANRFGTTANSIRVSRSKARKAIQRNLGPLFNSLETVKNEQ